jgi:hypothetical protein
MQAESAMRMGFLSPSERWSTLQQVVLFCIQDCVLHGPWNVERSHPLYELSKNL